MKRFKITALAALAVFAAFAAMAGSASAATIIKLVDPLGQVANGTTITASSTNLKTKTSAGTLECKNNILPTVLQKNGTAAPAGSGTEEKSFGEAVGVEGPCTTTIGPAVITTGNFPWTVSFKESKLAGHTGQGEVLVKATGGTKKVKFTSVFPALGGLTCVFEASKIQSFITLGKPGSPVPVVFNTEKNTTNVFKGAKTNNAACPKTGEIYGEWNLTDANGIVSEE